MNFVETIREILILEQAKPKVKRHWKGYIIMDSMRNLVIAVDHIFVYPVE